MNRSADGVSGRCWSGSILRALAGSVLGLLLCGAAAGQEVYQDSKAALESRVEDLFKRLTQDEKLGLLGGTGFTTQPIPRLGVPAMSMVDAGQGVRGGMHSTEGPATAFPSGVAMGATWDPELMQRLGRAIGEEARNKGTGSQVLLGPAVNIHRSPLGGRNGEYMSEDPFLAARLAVGYIEGMQGTGVAACIKHFACNNEEVDRMEVNATVSERALREIYLPAFEAGVREAKVWTLMSSYNKVNGPHASASHYLLTDVLKKGWGFDGLVMSDWGGVHETPVVQAGNDLEMPTGANMSVKKLTAALAAGTVTQAAVDDSVRRILRTVIRVGLLDHPAQPDPSKVNSAEHDQVAFEVAAEGVVLLKNEGAVLPLDRQQIKSIALIGEPARKLQVGALGSPEVSPLHTTQILDGIKKAAGSGVNIRFSAGRTDGDLLDSAVVSTPGTNRTPGFQAEYFTNERLQGSPALVRVDSKIDISERGSPAPGISPDHFSVRWTGDLAVTNSGNYSISFTGDDGFRVFLNEKPLLQHWTRGRATTLSADTTLEAGKTYQLKVEYFQRDGDSVAQLRWRLPSQPAYGDALEAAKSADVAIVCVSTKGTEGEGHDRAGYELPGDQAGLIRAVAAANKHTVVVLNNGTPVAMKDWIDRVPALLEAWFPGQEGGAAIAAVLFGDVNPSGKLPDTFGAARQDYPEATNFPGQHNEVNYAEGIYVGYRHFDKKGIQPVYPFGYGLSYTTFKYKNLKLSQSTLRPDGSVTVSADIVNTGKRDGEEVVQLYVRDTSPKTDKPVRELKGFSKVALKAGETKTVTFTLTPRALAYFDEAGRQWKADAGKYQVQVGASSRDLRLKASLELSQTYTDKTGL